MNIAYAVLLTVTLFSLGSVLGLRLFSTFFLSYREQEQFARQYGPKANVLFFVGCASALLMASMKISQLIFL